MALCRNNRPLARVAAGTRQNVEADISPPRRRAATATEAGTTLHNRTNANARGKSSSAPFRCRAQEEHAARVREQKKLAEAQKVVGARIQFSALLSHARHAHQKRLEAERKQNYLDRSHVRKGQREGAMPRESAGVQMWHHRLSLHANQLLSVEHDDSHE